MFSWSEEGVSKIVADNSTPVRAAQPYDKHGSIAEPG